MKKYFCAPLLILFLISCSDDTNTEQISEQFLVSITQERDTLNSHERLEIQFNIDDSIFNNQIEFMNYQYFESKLNIERSNYGMIIIEVSEAEQDSIITYDHKVTINYKLKNDTTLYSKEFPINFYLTNKETTSRTRGTLVNGMKNGLWEFYRMDNHKGLFEQSNWSNNVRHGQSTIYSYKGKVSQIYNYNNGIKDGAQIYVYSGDTVYYDNGVKQ